MIADIAAITAAIGVLSALVGLRQVYRGRQRQFEMMYVERYWSTLDRLSHRASAAASERDHLVPEPGQCAVSVGLTAPQQPTKATLSTAHHLTENRAARAGTPYRRLPGLGQRQGMGLYGPRHLSVSSRCEQRGANMVLTAADNRCPNRRQSHTASRRRARSIRRDSGPCRGGS